MRYDNSIKIYILESDKRKVEEEIINEEEIFT